LTAAKLTAILLCTQDLSFGLSMGSHSPWYFVIYYPFLRLIISEALSKGIPRVELVISGRLLEVQKSALLQIAEVAFSREMSKFD